MPNFEVFQRTDSRRRSRQATVTVQRRGQISFSLEAMRVLGNPEAVAFLVDKDERLLGFRAAKLARNGARRADGGDGLIVCAVRSPGATASAVQVLRYLGADLSASRRYPLAEVDGVRFIDLKAPGAVVTSNRRKAGTPPPA